MPPKKLVLRTLAIFPLLMVLHLSLAGLWAFATVDELLDHLGPMQVSTLSPRQTEILLRIEDPTFYEHAGVSLADGQGVATITSAIARELFLYGQPLGGIKGAFQNYFRKIFDCCKKVDFGRDVMAMVLNARLTKDAQLALYASQVYMGSNEGRQLRGLDEAAQFYLGKRMPALDEREFAALVAMIKAPNQYHPTKNRAAYDTRVARVDAVISGKCRPNGWFDTEYLDCKP